MFCYLPAKVPACGSFVRITNRVSTHIGRGQEFCAARTRLRGISFRPKVSISVGFIAAVTIGLTVSLLGQSGRYCARELLPRLARCALMYGAGGAGINKRVTRVFSCPLRIAADVIIPCSAVGFYFVLGSFLWEMGGSLDCYFRIP